MLCIGGYTDRQKGLPPLFSAYLKQTQTTAPHKDSSHPMFTRPVQTIAPRRHHAAAKRLGLGLGFGARCAAACLLLLAASPAWSAAGVIQMVMGQARVWERSGLERTAQRGVQLYEGDTVATGANSNVQIRMSDEAMIWLRPDTRLRIDEYAVANQKGDKERGLLSLINGSFRTLTGSIGVANKANYEIATPNATIGIRGTDHEVAFIGPGGAQRGEPGTYNRVYSGSTFLQSAAGRTDIPAGQAGFAGLQPGAAPRVLPAIPDFMNQSTPPAGASPAPGAAKAAAPRQLMVSLRYGAPPDTSSSVTTSSRDASVDPNAQRIQVLEGQRAMVNNSWNSPSGARPSSSMDVLARVSGDTVTVQLLASRETGSVSDPGSSQSQQIGTTLTMRLGQWTEVSGHGAWPSTQNSQVTSSSSNRENNRKVFLRVDEMKR